MHSRTWVLGTIIVLILSFGGYISYKTIIGYRDNLVTVTEKRIVEAAKKCFDEDNCLEFPITLKMLYEKEYLSEEVNPLTKEVYSEDSYIEKVEDQLVFYPLY